MVLVELVLRVVVFVEESQCDMRLGVQFAANELVRNTVLAQKIAGQIPFG